MSALLHDVVSGEQYRYALTNFRIAHEKVEQQRVQLEEQEKQVALLRERIATLEGTNQLNEQKADEKQGGYSVDDFSIKNAASRLERQINRWATELLRTPPVDISELRDAVLSDIFDGEELEIAGAARPMEVQNLLRHSMADTISEAIVNSLIVTSSTEANDQLTRIHEHIFARDPTVAAVWRRQTFSAAVDKCSPEMSRSILEEHMPTLMQRLSPAGGASATAVLNAAVDFSRMLHGSPSSAGGTVDAFYRSFVPEIGSTLYPRQVELVKRCLRSERGELDRVGATIFPGLVKVSRSAGPDAQSAPNTQAVVRRAQVICECALQAGSSTIDGSIPTMG